MPVNLKQLFSKREKESRSPYIVAEMACAHDGSSQRALAITKAAAKADALQIQLFHAENLVVPEKVPSASTLQLTSDEWKEVAQEARNLDLDLWATVFDEKAIKLASELGAKVLKVHSTDISNPFLLEACAKSDLPVSLSVGGTYVSEITAAIQLLERHGASHLMLTHGFQGFPTAPQDARLGLISTLNDLFPYSIGYQDHTDSDSRFSETLPLCAAALGASVIEKHITDDRSRQGTDYISALGPEKFDQFVEVMDSVSGAFLGHVPDVFSASEEEYRKSMKRRIAAKVDLDSGTKVTKENIILLRSESGIKADQIDFVVGREVQYPLRKNEVIKESHL